MPNKFNTPFYGFIETLDPATQNHARRKLSDVSIDKIENHTIAGDVVEEIVRRGGQFYTAKEARPIAPFTIKHDDTFCASFRYLDNETKPPNPAYAEKDWCALTVIQYCYGMYLTDLISTDKLTINDLIRSVESHA